METNSKESAASLDVAEITPTMVEGILRESSDLEQLMQVHALASYSEKARRMVQKTVESMRAKGDPRNLDKVVRVGAGLWMLESHQDAYDILQNSRANIAGAFFMAQALVGLGRSEEAVEILEKTVNRKPQSFLLRLAFVEALIVAGRPAEAKKALREAEKIMGKSARTLTLRGWILDVGGEHDQAREAYRKALDLDGDCGFALFRLAYNMDLYGDDEEAIELYMKCLALPHPNVNALMNLGVLYEDGNEYEKAVECYEMVLKSYPGHTRAQAFLKDAMSSMVEIVDEERDRMEDRRWQILQIPITDFELSVRSRNCLNKMEIRTLGDLVEKTEAELLNYKNFGETSLGEIKLILEAKNLRLGINLEEVRRGERKKRLEELFKKGAEDDDVAHRPISELGLSIRSRKCMELLNVESIGDLMRKSEKDLLGCKNFGHTSLLEVKRKLAEHGLNLSEPASE